MKKAVGIACLVCCVGLVAWLIKSAATRIRDSSNTVQCSGNFSSIAWAMHEYRLEYGHFPPAFIADESGKPIHSWRVLLLKYIDPETFLAYRFDEPWNGPNNRKLSDKMPDCYQCPADPASKIMHHTNYFVVVGPNTVFPGPKTVKWDDIARPTSDTILVVEALGRNVHWMEPKDLEFDTMSFQLNDPTRPSVSCNHRGCSGVVMVDGISPRYIACGSERLREMLQIK
jgi:hypothetical protein